MLKEYAKIRVISIATVVLILLIPLASAGTYIVDGCLDDWGINSTDLQYGLGSSTNISYWLPTNSTVDWIVENDIDPDCTGYCTLHPCYDYGVHVKGRGGSYWDYDEGCNYPQGGEKYDIEALYFDDNTTHCFFAIIVSDINLTGDLKITIDGVKYGVVLTDHDGLLQGAVYKNPGWAQYPDGSGSHDPQDPYVDPNNPGEYQGMATVVISPSGVYDHQWNNWIIEIGIEKSLIGYPSVGTPSYVRYTISCLNDKISNEIRFDYPIPEFLVLLLPIGLILGVVYYLRKS